MKKIVVHITCLLLLFAFTAKGIVPFIYPVIKANQIEKGFQQLSRIFGSETVICSSESEKNYFITTYKALGKEQKNKFLAKYELPVNSSKNDNYILSSDFSVIFKLRKNSILYIPDDIIHEQNPISFKSSRAPPALS